MSNYWDQAFSRNIGFLTQGEQRLLRDAVVAIPGLGGVGGGHLISLTRAGIGNFHIAEFDTFEIQNINRQYGAKQSNFGRPKLETMRAEALDINPHASIKSFSAGINLDNLDEFLTGVDVVVDGIDFFELDIRRALFKRAYEKGIYVVTAGPMGFSTSLLIFSPHKGLSFDSYFDIHDGMSEHEKIIAFAVGLSPKATHLSYIDLSSVNINERKGPSLGVGCFMSSAVSTTEVLRILLDRPGIKATPNYFQYDPYTREFIKGYLAFGNKNPIQRLKRKLVAKKAFNPKMTPKRKLPQLISQQIKTAYLSDDILRSLIEYGIQAPSGDNSQPWKFKLLPNEIELYLNEPSPAPYFDDEHRSSIMSCGAVVENLSLAASCYGLETVVDIFPQGVENRVAKIKLNRSDCDPDPLCYAIAERHTNRTLYRKISMTDTRLDSLSAVLKDHSLCNLAWVNDEAKLKQLANIYFKIDRFRMSLKESHEYFMSMLRFTDAEVEQKTDGLPLKNLELDSVSEQIIKMTRDWKYAKWMNRLGGDLVSGLISYQWIRQASAVGMITIAEFDKNNFFQAGRSFQRVWLQATRLGYSFQPMMSLPLFWIRYKKLGIHSFPNDSHSSLKKCFDRFEDFFSESCDQLPVILFRIGIGKQIKQPTLRRDLGTFILP